MHTIRCVKYSGPPIDGETPEYVYVVGYRGAVASLEVWTPIVVSRTFGRAIIMVNALNGGPLPDDTGQWVNVMAVDELLGTVQAKPSAGTLHDYPRGQQWPASEIARPATLKKSKADDE